MHSVAGFVRLRSPAPLQNSNEFSCSREIPQRASFLSVLGSGWHQSIGTCALHPDEPQGLRDDILQKHNLDAKQPDKVREHSMLLE